MQNQKPKTLLDKIWEEHFIHQDEGSPAIIYIDAHLIHEVTSPQAFTGLGERGIKVRRPDRTFATIDHSLPTKIAENRDPFSRMNFADIQSKNQIQQLQKNCEEHGISLCDLDSPYQGIVHVIGPELGITQPGKTIVCGDSHTATHGAFGCLAFGIGTSEVEHVLASQCLLQYKPKNYRVIFNGGLQKGVTSKDVILYLISKIGTNGGTQHVFEYTGSLISKLNMEERMTICNMSIEAGARAGLIAPDEITFDYLKGRLYSPQGKEWDKALEYWKSLNSDPGSEFDQSIEINTDEIQPMVTFGTNPGMAIAVGEKIPEKDTSRFVSHEAFVNALRYVGLDAGDNIEGKKVDVVFIGSCTNSRITDLRQAAGILRGKKVSDNTKLLVVSGSQEVKAQAEAEGLDRIFIEAGAEWREPGCSMCIAMNGDELKPGQYAVSTSNRNFEGRQGKGSRTFLASPLTAAASAIEGKVCDPRKYL